MGLDTNSLAQTKVVGTDNIGTNITSWHGRSGTDIACWHGHANFGTDGTDGTDNFMHGLHRLHGRTDGTDFPIPIRMTEKLHKNSKPVVQRAARGAVVQMFCP